MRLWLVLLEYDYRRRLVRINRRHIHHFWFGLIFMPTRWRWYGLAWALTDWPDRKDWIFDLFHPEGDS